jgi:hypothetical protein
MNTDIVNVAELNDQALDSVTGGRVLLELAKYVAWDLGILTMGLVNRTSATTAPTRTAPAIAATHVGSVTASSWASLSTRSSVIGTAFPTACKRSGATARGRPPGSTAATPTIGSS